MIPSVCFSSQVKRYVHINICELDQQNLDVSIQIKLVAGNMNGNVIKGVVAVVFMNLAVSDRSLLPHYTH
jgi:hypothetical protein